MYVLIIIAAMKFIIFTLICNYTLSYHFVLPKILQERDDVDVTSQNLEKRITLAISGLRHIIRNGNTELGYPLMDPYTLEDLIFDYDDSVNTLHSRNTNTTTLTGLAGFEISHLKVDPKNLTLSATLMFNLEAQGPYKLDGFLFQKLLPIYGEGNAKFVANELFCQLEIALSLENSFLVVDKVNVSPYLDFDVTATNLLDLSPEFSDFLLQDLLQPIFHDNLPQWLENFVRNLVQDAVGGMTFEELFEYLDYLAEQAY